MRHSFPAYESFREVVDAAMATLNDDPVPGEFLVYPAAYDAIGEAIAPGTMEHQSPVTNDVSADLGDVMSEITYSNVLFGTPLEPYLSCAQTLYDALRQQGPTEAIRVTSKSWIRAIRFAISYDRARETQNAGRNSAKQVTLALAVKYFEERQIDLRMYGSCVHVASQAAKIAVAASVFHPLQVLGDTLTAQLLDKLLDDRYDHNIGRLRLHPVPDMMGQKVERQLPYGLLYRFALKTLGHKTRPLNRKALASRSLEAAVHFAALHDVEPFSVYETMFPPKTGKLLTVLNDITTFDELFTIPQCSPGVVQRLLDEIRENAPAPESTKALCWSMGNAIELWRLLLQVSNQSVQSTFISRKNFRTQLIRRIGLSAAEALLRSFVIRHPNAEYYFPADAYLADTRDCCLVEASGDRHWLPGQLLLAPAFFARLVGIRAQHSQGFNSQMGKAFELYLVKRMQALGIACRYGDIQGTTKGSTAGDIDLLVETEDTIGLFELKKKTLCRASTAGTGLQLIVDLAHGLVRGVTQLAKHEMTLVRDGELKFREGPPLALNGRRIVKGVISLADFGGLHDASIVRNMLQGLMGATFSTSGNVTPQQSKDLQTANSYCATLLKRHQEFNAMKGDSNSDLFDNFVFRNVFFVEYLLSRETTSKGFLTALSTGMRMANGSRDPFFEHAQMNPYPVMSLV